MFFLGIDIGSACIKALLLDKTGAVRASLIGPTGPDYRRFSDKVVSDVLKMANIGLDDISCVAATGYGRFHVPFANRQVTELTCHAIGVAQLFPSAGTVIDIGGQDTKVLRIVDGRLDNFVMNDKCAAGTGRFLDILSKTLGLSVENLGELSLNSSSKININNICALFAQSEVIHYISKGIPLEDIIAGLHDGIAGRVASLVKRIGLKSEVVFTGGVAKNVGVIKSIGDRLKIEIIVPDEPQIVGALGAAIMAKRLYLGRLKR